MKYYKTTADEVMDFERYKKSPRMQYDILALKRSVSIKNELESVNGTLDKIICAIDDENQKKARELYRNAWFRASRSSLYRRLFSETEIKKSLNEKGELAKISNIAKKVKDGIGQIIKISQIMADLFTVIEICKAFVCIHESEQAKYFESSIAMPKGENVKVTAAQKQMAALLNVLETLLPFAPRGICEYIQWNFQVFYASRRLTPLVKKYTLAIENAGEVTAQEVMKLFASRGATAIKGTWDGLDEFEKAPPRNQ